MLLNKEKFAKEIVEIITSEDNECLAVDVHTGKPCKCSVLRCGNCLFCADCKGLRNKWANSEYIEPINLTLVEKIVLENFDKKYKWLVRERDGELLCFERKPTNYYVWEDNGGDCCELPFSKLFEFIKSEDDEPYNIQYILDNCEIIEDD